MRHAGVGVWRVKTTREIKLFHVLFQHGLVFFFALAWACYVHISYLLETRGNRPGEKSIEQEKEPVFRWVTAKDENGRSRSKKTFQPFSTFTFEIRKRKRKRASRTRKRTRTYGISRISKTNQFERNYVEHGRYAKIQYEIPTHSA